MGARLLMKVLNMETSQHNLFTIIILFDRRGENSDLFNFIYPIFFYKKSIKKSRAHKVILFILIFMGKRIPITGT